MVQVLKLLLPALVPSWRFFDVIAPSPRIQFALLNAQEQEPSEWHEFRPRPARVTFIQMLGRMVWNPLWNESLYMISCAERLLEHPTRHSEDEILKRIEAGFKDVNAHVVTATHLQFRLLVVRREGQQLQHELVFMSRIRALSGPDRRGRQHESG